MRKVKKWRWLSAVISAAAIIYVIGWKEKRCQSQAYQCRASYAAQVQSEQRTRRLSVYEQASEQQAIETACEPNGYFCRLFSAANIPTVLLVFVGICGIWAAIRTLKTIERQTEAVRESVKVQEKAMKLTVNAERPYLVISVESPSPNNFVFVAKNEGRTPARIKSIWSKPIPAVMGKPGPVPSDEETAESLISTPPQLLPPKGTCTAFYCDEHRLELMGASKFSGIYFYGRIIYFNTLETAPDKPYETKWLYFLIPGTVKGSIPFPDPRHPEHNTWT